MTRKRAVYLITIFLVLVGLPMSPSLLGNNGRYAAVRAEPSRHSQEPLSIQERSVQERIEAVQNGLLPPETGNGRPAEMKLGARMAYYKIPGVSIAVINEGRIEWARGFGVKEAGQHEPVDQYTLFEAGSISKPVAAMAAMRLVQEGRLNLDGNVNDRLSTWKVPDNQFTRARKVTLRELLSHTAGMTVHGFPGYTLGTPVPSLVQVLNGTSPANTEAIRVDTVPATQWRYSGGGYTVMQLLLIDVTGKRFPEVLRENVLGRIGMGRSTYEQPLPQAWQPRAATAHDGGRPVKGKWNIYPEMAAAGLWTTPSDLAQFAIEIQKELAGTSDKVLSSSTARLMVTPVMNGYALGLGIDGAGDAARFGHNGVDFGFEALMVAYEKTGQGAVIMTNGVGGQALCSEIIRGVARVYHWSGYPMR